MKKLLLFLACYIVAAAARSHPMPYTVFAMDVHSNAISANLQIPLKELQFAVPFNVTDSTETIVARLESPLQAYFLDHLRITDTAGNAWKIEVGHLEVANAEQTATGPYQELTIPLSLIPSPGSDVRNFVLHYDAIVHQLVTHKIMVVVRHDFAAGLIGHAESELGLIYMHPATGIVDPLEVHLTAGSSWKGFTSMCRLGIDHIREGTDHLLFLLVLLLPAVCTVEKGRWVKGSGAKYSIIRLLKFTAAFTVGHSLTLALAATHILVLPSQPVEIIITLTIFITAIHSVVPILYRREVLVAGCFGLIHGLAFSSAIAELHLGARELLLSILGFNIGIEAMQLYIVLLVVPWLMVLGTHAIYNAIRWVGALLAIAAALGWMTERITLQPNIITHCTEVAAGYSYYGLLVLVILAAYVLIQARQRKGLKPHDGELRA